MDRRESTLNLVDKCTFYVERAAIYLPLFASSMLEPAVGATMLVTLFVLTSLLTMLAYWKLHVSIALLHHLQFNPNSFC